MRVVILAALLVTLAACSGDAAAPQGEAQASEPAGLLGRFNAASDTARTLTGDLVIERGGLVFNNGVILFTRALNPRRGFDRIARDGDSYAAVAVGPADLNVELRHITEQSVSEGARGLCDKADPTYVALAYEPRATSVTILVFAGDEPPSADATNSWLCATFAFAAPNGARTRQGVVLQ